MEKNPESLIDNKKGALKLRPTFEDIQKIPNFPKFEKNLFFLLGLSFLHIYHVRCYKFHPNCEE